MSEAGEVWVPSGNSEVQGIDYINAGHFRELG